MVVQNCQSSIGASHFETNADTVFPRCSRPSACPSAKCKTAHVLSTNPAGHLPVAQTLHIVLQ